jgi:hypothetical protein
VVIIQSEAPGNLVRIFKGIAAREIFKQKASGKKELWDGEF